MRHTLTFNIACRIAICNLVPVLAKALFQPLRYCVLQSCQTQMETFKSRVCVGVMGYTKRSLVSTPFFILLMSQWPVETLADKWES